ncbi:MAG TPA: hypothetical protein VKE98_24575 [Gemmataceae bacterium]|nr:hypothetical protein [Gemmataceae bacterium]
MAESIDHGRFITLLAERFPIVAASIGDCFKGKIHLEVATLATATQASIDDQDKGTVQAHFEFIDEVLPEATPDLENAIYVSYLEKLWFEGRKAAPTRARDLLTPRLRQALADLEEYLDRLFAGSKHTIKEKSVRRLSSPPHGKRPKSPRRKR